MNCVVGKNTNQRRLLWFNQFEDMGAWALFCDLLRKLKGWIAI